MYKANLLRTKVVSTTSGKLLRQSLQVKPHILRMIQSSFMNNSVPKVLFASKSNKSKSDKEDIESSKKTISGKSKKVQAEEPKTKKISS